MISSPVKGQPLPLCVRLLPDKCLWPLLLPEDFQLRGSLNISLMLGKIVSGSGVLFVPLGKGETFRQRECSSQLSIPLCFTGKVRDSRRMDLSPCSENTSVFTSPSSIAAEGTCFSQLLPNSVASCAICTGRWKEWGCGRGKCFTTRRGTRT